MREVEIEQKAREYVEKHGGELLKVRVLGRSGFPDRMVIFPGGALGFVEFKKPGKEPGELQKKWLRDLRNLLIPAIWTDDLDDFKRWANGFKSVGSLPLSRPAPARSSE